MDVPDPVPPGDLPALLARPGDLVVVFHATWCPFSRRFLAKLGGLAEGGPPLAVVDLSDEDDPAWDGYRVTHVPTAIRFRDGREVARAPAIPMVGLPADRFGQLLAEA